MPLFSCKLITSHIILESRTPDYWMCQSLHLLMQLCVCACVCVWFQSSQEKETNIVHREPCITLNATHFLLCCQNTKQHFLLSVKFNQMSDSFHYVTDHLKTYWLKTIHWIPSSLGWLSPMGFPSSNLILQGWVPTPETMPPDEQGPSCCDMPLSFSNSFLPNFPAFNVYAVSNIMLFLRFYL